MRAQRLSARGVVAFADVDWSGTWYSRHQILSRLASVCPVVVVGHPVDARSVLSGRVPGRPVLEQVAENLWSYRAPRFLPSAYRPQSIARALDRLRAWHLEATLRQLGLMDPIYYVWHPEFAPAVARLPRRFTAYHCYDKYDAYVGADVAAMRALEDRLVTDSDLVLASSRALAAELEARTGHAVRYLPHGVDFEFFRERSARDPLPADLAALARPRIGYVARLDERIDDDALRAIAVQRPGWTIVIIGASGFRSAEGDARFAALTALPNVRALGPKPREAVPAYTAGLDVCLLCYRTDNWGRWVQPIKAYEYLACGRPVVSSPIEAARDFGDLIAVAPSADRWVEAIEGVLAAERPEKAAERIEFARRNTWDQRIAELVEAFERQLEPGPG